MEYGLDDKLRSKDKAFVLFYASWCPFSQKFLPTFEKFAQHKTDACLSIKTDNKTSLCEKYSVEVVPTILFFKKGKVAKRLDGVPGAGLNENMLADFASRC